MAFLPRARQGNCRGSTGIEPTTATGQLAEAGCYTNPSSQQTTTLPPSTTSPSSSLDDTVDAGEMDDDIDHAPRGMARWNEYRGPHFTAKAGLGFLIDTAAYAQAPRDSVSDEETLTTPLLRHEHIITEPIRPVHMANTTRLRLVGDGKGSDWIRWGGAVYQKDPGAQFH